MASVGVGRQIFRVGIRTEDFSLGDQAVSHVQEFSHGEYFFVTCVQLIIFASHFLC